MADNYTSSKTSAALDALTTPATTDLIPVWDVSAGYMKKTTVSELQAVIDTDTTYTAGSGLDLTSGVFSVDINSETSVTAASGDELLISDVSDANNIKKVTAQSIADLGGGGGGQEGFAIESTPNTAPTATRTDAVAIGEGSVASGYYSFSCGPRQAEASSSYAIAIGDLSKANSTSGIALGARASAKAQYAIAIGGGATTNAGAEASGSNSISIGRQSNATGLNSIAIGTDANSTSTYAMALGPNAQADYAGQVGLNPENTTTAQTNLAASVNLVSIAGGSQGPVGTNGAGASNFKLAQGSFAFGQFLVAGSNSGRTETALYRYSFFIYNNAGTLEILEDNADLVSSTTLTATFTLSMSLDVVTLKVTPNNTSTWGAQQLMAIEY